MRTAKLKWTAAVVGSAGLLGLAGVGTALAWPRTGPPVVAVLKPDLPLSVAAPEPPERPIEGDWLPKKPGAANPPTAFPSLKAVGPKGELTTACPRLFGENGITIDPTDDTYRRLLKARLHQGALEIWKLRTRIEIGQYVSTEFSALLLCADDMRAAAVELWANDPQNLIPVLEELVILAKDWERFTEARVSAGTDPPQQLNTAHRHRLAAEAALWKAKAGKPGGR